MGAFDFTGRRVLVTGASHGIGFAVARAFAGAGAELAILSSTADIDGAAARIEAESGRPVRALICDVTDREAVRRTVGALGALDVLVNNAGLELITPILEPGDAVEKTFVRIIEINVIGTYYVSREAVPLMGRGGSIVLTSSIWGQDRRRRLLRLRHLQARQHRLHAHARQGARAPGHTRQRRLSGLGQDPRGAALAEGLSARADMSEEAMLEDILSAQALPGLMEPDDVASLYLFLASDHAASVTGQAYNVDRGEVMA